MHDASLCGSSAGAQQSCGRHRALSDTCCQQYGHPAHTYRRGVQERLEVSNVCELPHEHATARTMHVSIAVSPDRGMCKHVVRRGAGETAGTMLIEIEAKNIFFLGQGRPTAPYVTAPTASQLPCLPASSTRRRYGNEHHRPSRIFNTTRHSLSVWSSLSVSVYVLGGL